ncbi:hypothetical protein DM01DRAFT_1405116 [Hesseltinella vesiculosa]|uniref:TFIIB-type domain-containing protein n=1 Tax=Hesseltinella vesiculosa TaxID=101127 RepID=A0A1X2GR25_9FUNG|nr:hypothetical protein DM01DRAFT_1405116 [Hesseltinella vesiculosa]
MASQCPACQSTQITPDGKHEGCCKHCGLIFEWSPPAIDPPAAQICQGSSQTNNRMPLANSRSNLYNLVLQFAAQYQLRDDERLFLEDLIFEYINHSHAVHIQADLELVLSLIYLVCLQYRSSTLFELCRLHHANHGRSLRIAERAKTIFYGKLHVPSITASTVLERCMLTEYPKLASSNTWWKLRKSIARPKAKQRVTDRQLPPLPLANSVVSRRASRLLDMADHKGLVAGRKLQPLVCAALLIATFAERLHQAKDAAIPSPLALVWANISSLFTNASADSLKSRYNELVAMLDDYSSTVPWMNSESSLHHLDDILVLNQALSRSLQDADIASLSSSQTSQAALSNPPAAATPPAVATASPSPLAASTRQHPSDLPPPSPTPPAVLTAPTPPTTACTQHAKLAMSRASLVRPAQRRKVTDHQDTPTKLKRDDLVQDTPSPSTCPLDHPSFRLLQEKSPAFVKWEALRSRRTKQLADIRNHACPPSIPLDNVASMLKQLWQAGWSLQSLTSMSDKEITAHHYCLHARTRHHDDYTRDMDRDLDDHDLSALETWAYLEHS